MSEGTSLGLTPVIPPKRSIFPISKVTLFSRLLVIFVLPLAGGLIRYKPGQCISKAFLEGVDSATTEKDMKTTNCSQDIVSDVYMHIIEQQVAQLDNKETRLTREKQLLRVQEFSGMQHLVLSMCFSLWMITILSLILNYKADTSTIMTCEFVLMELGAIFCLFFSVVEFVYGNGVMLREVAEHLCEDNNGSNCKDGYIKIQGLFGAALLLFVAGMSFLSQVLTICMDPVFDDEYEIDERIATTFLGPTLPHDNIDALQDEEIQQKVEQYKMMKSRRKKVFDRAARLESLEKLRKKLKESKGTKSKALQAKLRKMLEDHAQIKND